MADPNKQEKAKNYLLDNANKFSPADFKKFADKSAKPIKQPKNFITDKTAFDNAMVGILGKKPTKGKKLKQWNRQTGVLAGMYQERLNDYKDINNVDVVPEPERRKILDEFAIQAIRKDTFLGIDWLNPDEDVGIDDIPIDDLEAIRNALESNGNETTPENILQLYLSQQ